MRFVLLAALALVGLGVGVWYFLRPKPPAPDLVAAAHANARGIGYMEQFETKHGERAAYDLAIEAFETAEKLAPDWTPAKVNLGIALLNTRKPENLDRALAIFQRILEKDDKNPYAHYCAGIIHYHRDRLAEAGPHFLAVTDIDPSDASSWYWYGRCFPDYLGSAESLVFFEKALNLNPYLNAARYAVAQHVKTADDERRKTQLLDDFQTLVRANAHDLLDLKYTEMGRYGEVIGKSPAPAPAVGVMPMFDLLKGPPVKLAGGTAWAANDTIDEPRKLIRERFGGAAVLFDYDRDGRPDVLLLGAVIRDGKVGDLLLRNEGNNAFTDATTEAGLVKHVGSFGGAAGDFDNDGLPDVALAGPDGMRLFRNNGKAFEDRTAAAGFDKEPGVFLTATWVDLDQDGDLDLAAAKFAHTPELALKQLNGGRVEGNGRLVAFANAGEAPPAQPSQPAPPLTVAFKRLADDVLKVEGPITGVVATDVDGDFDVDLLVLADGQQLVAVLNDRLLRFHRGLIPAARLAPVEAARWNGGFVLDANGDDQSDIALVVDGGVAQVLVSTKGASDMNFGRRFALSRSVPPVMRAAAWCDLDLDGRTDILGLSVERKPAFLQGDGNGTFARKNEPFGPAVEAIPDLLAVASVDLDGDNVPDVLMWSASGGLRVARNLGNGNNALKLTLTGMRKPVMAGEEGKPLRTNADAVGAWVRLHAGPLRTAAENTTLFAGLGQSRLPLHFGIGKADTIEALRVRWPDAVVQAEVNEGPGARALVELDRKPSSCPILFTWDGERFAYVTDFLGAGSVGESGPDGSVRPPRPEESVKIEPGRLAPRNGKFVLKVGEPMDEVMYLDRLRLDVIDHPAGVSVFPDERFATSDPQPTQERLYFRDSDRLFATKATDHKGRDVTATLRERDGKHVEGFALRSWLGFAEDHSVELDFGTQLRSLPAGRKVYLVLAGWTDYAFPESIYAATQAGVPPVWPVLEQKQTNGSWKPLGEIGLPAGLTRVMTKDVTGWIDPTGGPVRIRTNLQIYWDQAFLAPVADVEKSVRELPVARASLEQRGFTQEYRPGGKLPIAYDYDRLEPVLVSRWRGKLTRTGDVTELLATDDDRHAVCGPGDEVTAEFDASSLPPLREGWQRSFVLRTWGYVKDSAPTTLTAGSVSPLPHRGMKQFPYDPAKEPPPAVLVEYDRVWNTRPAGRR